MRTSSSTGQRNGWTLIGEGGRVHTTNPSRGRPRNGVYLSPEESFASIVSGKRSLLINKAFCAKQIVMFSIDFDILERQEDFLESQMDSSEKRDDNGKDHGHQERLTEILGLQPISLYAL